MEDKIIQTGRLSDASKPADRFYERDPVTGCYAMFSFLEHVEYFRRQGQGRTDSIVYFNIPEFKLFNDTYGLDRGNQVLAQIAGILRDVFRTTCIARFYADEFFVFYDQEDVMDKVTLSHDRVRGLAADFKFILIAGIARITGEEPASSYCDYAKMACDEVRRDGKEFVRIYTKEMRDTLYRKKYLQDSIDRAIREGNIEIYYQPVIRALTGKLCGAEALARWNDPDYGMLSPAVFIPALEERYLSYKLDCYVVKKVCSDLHERMQKGLPVVPVSVNFSRKDFAQCDPVSVVEEAVSKYKVSRDLLYIEITESAMMEDPDKVHSLICRFHRAGYQVWMDDFGSGYSTLNMLDEFRFDEIKLDLVFMRGFSSRTKVIVRHINNMARDLGVHTLQEGVETKEQVDFLRDIGCEKLQGFYYSQPLPVAKLTEVLDNKGILFESGQERPAFDAINRLAFKENEKFLLAWFDGQTFDLIYLNPGFREHFKQYGYNGSKETVNDVLNNRTAAAGVKLRSKAQKALESGETVDFYSVYAQRSFHFTIQKLASVGDRSIMRLGCEDITGEKEEDHYRSFLNSISDVYHTVYRLDYENSRIEVVTSVMPDEKAGDMIDLKSSELLDRIHPLDRERFLHCCTREYVREKMKTTGYGHYSDPYRIRVGRDYVWTECMLVRVFSKGKTEILCCLKPDLLEARPIESPAIVQTDG